MLKATGFTDDELARPIVGVATTLDRDDAVQLEPASARPARQARIREAGGTPLEFNTIAVSDGVSMGTEGMRASLVSRELIADSIELVARGHLFDGLVCLVGCDKTIPAAVMALARLDLPGLAFYNGSIAPGRSKGADVTIQDVFEAVGAHAAGRMSPAEVHALEGAACPGAGACGGQFTANTMSTAVDFLGIAPGRPERDPRPPPRQARARRGGRQARHQLVRDDLGRRRSSRARRSTTPPRDRGERRLDERRAAPARDRARARHAVHRSRTSTRSRRGHPWSASLKPGGRFVATDLHAAGGYALVARELLKRDACSPAPRRTSMAARSAQSRRTSRSRRDRRSSSRWSRR